MKILLLSLAITGLLAQNELYDSFKFQDASKYYMIQQQYQWHQRAKSGNLENYGITSQTFFIEEAEFGDIEALQQNTNIGNYNEINGDNNDIEQSSEGQTNLNESNDVKEITNENIN